MNETHGIFDHDILGEIAHNLRLAGYNVSYMHGPTAIYEGRGVTAMSRMVPDLESIPKVLKEEHPKGHVFLYEILPNTKYNAVGASYKLRYGFLPNEA